MTCEKNRMELQSLMRILSRIPTSRLVHKFACVYNRLTQGSNEKAANICLKLYAKHRLLLSAATPLFAVGCLASGASSDHQIHSTESKGDEKCQ